MSEKRFNIRVYGILINDRNEVLLSDERYSGLEFTKFPGGGLEMGEGIQECIKREFREELDLPIEIRTHYYTTDFFQSSAFDPKQQLISIYYKVSTPNLELLSASNKPFNFNPPDALKAESHRWVDLNQLETSIFKWPIDKHVCGMLMNEFKQNKRFL